MNSSGFNAQGLGQRVSRRDFSRLLAATAAFVFSRAAFAQSGKAPSMMLGERDAFSSVDVLRMRYAAGRRPPDDIAGDALSWLLTGKKDFGEKCIATMRASALSEPGSRSWPTYASHALAFDWLYEFPAFDEELKDQIMKQLLEGAMTMASTPD